MASLGSFLFFNTGLRLQRYGVETGGDWGVGGGGWGHEWRWGEEGGGGEEGGEGEFILKNMSIRLNIALLSSFSSGYICHYCT